MDPQRANEGGRGEKGASALQQEGRTLSLCPSLILCVQGWVGGAGLSSEARPRTRGASPAQAPSSPCALQSQLFLGCPGGEAATGQVARTQRRRTRRCGASGNVTHSEGQQAGSGGCDCVLDTAMQERAQHGGACLPPARRLRQDGLESQASLRNLVAEISRSYS